MTPSERWNKYFELNFTATGTVVQNKGVNPRNYLDTKLTLAGRFTKRIPPRDVTFGTRLTNYAVTTAQCPDPPDNDCLEARREGLAMFDSTVAFMRLFSSVRFGLDAGYESNQSFTVTQQKISGFVYGQVESWGSGSLLRMVNPAVRLAVDRIVPGSETPRAMAGDDSDYHRASAEAWFWIPIGATGGAPLVLTFNFRRYRELGASDVVKAANLDSYTLRTLTLSGTNGSFVSYSSGWLPFDQDDDVLALGWAMHF